MKALAIGAKIWFKTVLLNAVFFGVIKVLFHGWAAFGVSIFVHIAGFIVTLPLLLIIVPLVNISVKIPYSIHARIAWLTFYLMLIVIGFYMLLMTFASWSVSDLTFLQSLMGTTIAALLVAVFTTRTSLIKLNKHHDEAAQLDNVLKIINT